MCQMMSVIIWQGLTGSCLHRRDADRVIRALRAAFDALCMGTCRTQKQSCDWRADTVVGGHWVLWGREAGRDAFRKVHRVPSSVH